jgi:hypothetical protein
MRGFASSAPNPSVDSGPATILNTPSAGIDADIVDNEELSLTAVPQSIGFMVDSLRDHSRGATAPDGDEVAWSGTTDPAIYWPTPSDLSTLADLFVPVSGAALAGTIPLR